LAIIVIVTACQPSDEFPMTQPTTILADTRLAPNPRGLAAAFEFLRYFAASAGALGIDFGLYAVSIRLGLPYAAAALLGFTAGAVAAYLASVRWVFESRSIHSASLEFGLFVAVGVGGLLLTETLLWLFIERLGCPPMLSKLGSAGFVFVFNFVVRKAMLFRASHR
jgi:putative flippase GtrA